MAMAFPKPTTQFRRRKKNHITAKKKKKTSVKNQNATNATAKKRDWQSACTESLLTSGFQSFTFSNQASTNDQSSPRQESSQFEPTQQAVSHQEDTIGTSSSNTTEFDFSEAISGTLSIPSSFEVNNSTPASPSASLPSGLRTTPTKSVQNPSPTSASPPGGHPSSLSPTLRWIITLFSGRKKSPKANNHSLPTPPPRTTTTTRPSTTQELHNPQTRNPKPYSPPRTQPIPIPFNPRRHRKPQPPFIPPPHPDPAAARLAYKEELPASPHYYTGYAVVQPDIWVPEVVQRGFDVPGTQPLPKRLVTGTSTARLLDREGSAWGKYFARGE